MVEWPIFLFFFDFHTKFYFWKQKIGLRNQLGIKPEAKIHQETNSHFQELVVRGSDDNFFELNRKIYFRKQKFIKRKSLSMELETVILYDDGWVLDGWVLVFHHLDPVEIQVSSTAISDHQRRASNSVWQPSNSQFHLNIMKHTTNETQFGLENVDEAVWESSFSWFEKLIVFQLGSKTFAPLNEVYLETDGVHRDNEYIALHHSKAERFFSQISNRPIRQILGFTVAAPFFGSRSAHKYGKCT